MMIKAFKHKGENGRPQWTRHLKDINENTNFSDCVEFGWFSFKVTHTNCIQLCIGPDEIVEGNYCY